MVSPEVLAGLRPLVEDLATGRHALRPTLGYRQGVALVDLPDLGPVVVKEYIRGGFPRLFVRRTHLRRGPTRPVKELSFLRLAHDAGVRTPEPLGAIERGRVLYRGWLVTHLVAGARTLAEAVDLPEEHLGPLVDDVARQIELLVLRKILHVDLHPGNVLVTRDETPYVLDFDRATIRFEPAARLRERYAVRWIRAVRKRALPCILATRLAERLGVPEARLVELLGAAPSVD